MDAVNAQPSIFFRNCGCLAALVVLLYDHVSTFQFEFNSVWKRSLTPIKFVYIFSRYFGLMCQTVNTTLVFSKLRRIPVEQSLCKYWFAFLITTGTFLGMLLHGIVMLQVYALHQKDRKVGFFLVVSMCAIIGACVYTWTICYHHNVYDAICNLEFVPTILLYLGKESRGSIRVYRWQSRSRRGRSFCFHVCNITFFYFTIRSGCSCRISKRLFRLGADYISCDDM
ncbi:hypothetical protein BDQ17DRAFT_143011 [Cyathus striatus]|nr:hypothetical protein BDQ17DRAFT_143011 [Cyathus striatus]